jgi:hypothetical protein
MSYKTYALLKPSATPRRIKALVCDLEGYGCKVQVHYGAKRIDLEVPEPMERWIVLGGLAGLLSQYEDVLSWHPHFSHHAAPFSPDALKRGPFP